MGRMLQHHQASKEDRNTSSISTRQTATTQTRETNYAIRQAQRSISHKVYVPRTLRERIATENS